MNDETRARIEKEAESYSNLRVWPNEVKRYCRDSYAVGAMNEHSRITELLNTMDEYIALLSKGLVESAAFLDVHGWKYSQSDIDKGVELRAKIQSLKGKQQ